MGSDSEEGSAPPAASGDGEDGEEPAGGPWGARTRSRAGATPLGRQPDSVPAAYLGRKGWPYAKAPGRYSLGAVSQQQQPSGGRRSGRRSRALPLLAVPLAAHARPPLSPSSGGPQLTKKQLKKLKKKLQKTQQKQAPANGGGGRGGAAAAGGNGSGAAEGGGGSGGEGGQQHEGFYNVYGANVSMGSQLLVGYAEPPPADANRCRLSPPLITPRCHLSAAGAPRG